VTSPALRPVDTPDDPSAPRWDDLRGWIAQAERLGELRTVRGASWEDDIGEATAVLDRNHPAPAVVFDEVPGYPAGFRILVNANGTDRRQALTLGLAYDDEQSGHGQLMAFWRRRLIEAQPIEPVRVETAAFFENRWDGEEVDLLRFPVPRWHPGDGGRYLATAGLTILRDPDTGVVNMGTYRGQVVGSNELGIFISPGHHGAAILKKYAERGEPCPVVSVVGCDPLLFMASCAEGLALGESELAWIGGVSGRAIEVVDGPVTGLPVPATSEIVLEGFIDPEDRRDEGPYGEWHGYYSAGTRPCPFIRVDAVHHRDDPIITGCPQGRPPHEDNRFLAYVKSALAERQLAGTAVPGVTAVWCPPELGNRLMTVVSIRQSYPGHATQVGLLAGQLNATAYGGRFVVVVDDDIEVSDLDEVMWALSSRVDPARDIQVVQNAWSSSLDTATPPGSGGLNSRLIFDATRPWPHRHEFASPVDWPGGNAAADSRWRHLLDRAHPNQLTETKDEPHDPAR
jgi:4-hydroxy-3-polyprenylbenzoate decarboxylase